MSPRKLIYNIMISLDGFIESREHDLNWVQIDEELHTFVNEKERGVGLWLYGRRMYELMAKFWPTADADPANPGFIADFSRIWKQKPKIVFSHALTHVEHNAQLAGADPASLVRELKSQPGGDIEVSGAELAGQLIRAGLVDEYIFYVNPVILGGGRSAFPALDAQANLKLLEKRAFSSGVIYLHYQAAE